MNEKYQRHPLNAPGPFAVAMRSLRTQRTPKRSIHVCAAIALATGTSGCWGDTLKWKEEVALHDGGQIVIERTAQVGSGRMEPGAQMMGWQKPTLDFTAPYGRKIHWEEPGHLEPMILDFAKGIPYLVTLPHLVIDYAIYKCPNPGYVIYKYINDWQRVAFGDFPKEISNRNLSPVTGQWERHARNGYITIQDMQLLIGARALRIPSDRKVDPNAKSPDGCSVTRIST